MCVQVLNNGFGQELRRRLERLDVLVVNIEGVGLLKCGMMMNENYWKNGIFLVICNRFDFEEDEECLFQSSFKYEVIVFEDFIVIVVFGCVLESLFVVGEGLLFFFFQLGNVVGNLC